MSGNVFQYCTMGKSKEETLDRFNSKERFYSKESKVCSRHFVLGRSSSLPNSVDYYQSKHLGLISVDNKQASEDDKG